MQFFYMMRERVSCIATDMKCEKESLKGLLIWKTDSLESGENQNGAC